MIVHNKIHTYKISWLSRSYDKDSSTGMIENYYEPETVEELCKLCSRLYRDNSSFLVVGHTSNLYFKPDCNILNLVSTKHLKKWLEHDSYIECECGVIVSKLSRDLIDKGINGYEGFIDLPGTIGGGVYGNAGCYGSLMSDLVLSVKMLLPNGNVCEFSNYELKFGRRTSALKDNFLQGVLLSVRLKKIKGDKSEIQNKAKWNHENRIQTQPRKALNLGSIHIADSKLSIIGYIVMGLSFLYSKLKNWKGTGTERLCSKMKASCFLLGVSGLEIYVPYGWNRFMWLNQNAHHFFPKYLRCYKLIHKNSKLEIEIIR